MSSMTTQPSIAGADDAIQQRQKRAALAVAMLGFAVVALDAQITNIALPTIREHLGGGSQPARADRRPPGSGGRGGSGYIERDPRVAASVDIWPGPEGGNLGPQITG